tara:strand:- start:519 stop:800 length:282 start_codon:yes stop_codon:yes gene_type:complete
VEKIVEIIKEVEKYIQVGGGGGNDSDCDCLTGARFIDVFNKIFNIKGMASSGCLTEQQFLDLISKSLIANVDSITNIPRDKSSRVQDLLKSPI